VRALTEAHEPLQEVVQGLSMSMRPMDTTTGESPSTLPLPKPVF